MTFETHSVYIFDLPWNGPVGAELYFVFSLYAVDERDMIRCLPRPSQGSCMANCLDACCPGSDETAVVSDEGHW